MTKEVLILYTKESSLDKVKYVFDFIFGLPFNIYQVNINYENVKNHDPKSKKDIIINYSNQKVENATIQISDTDIPNFIKSYKDFLSISSQAYTFENKILYGLVKNKPSESENQTEESFINGTVINLDIVSTFFVHLSRIEEFYCPDDLKDQHKRMIARHQFLVKNSLERIPVLDHISVAFLKRINFYEPIQTKKIMSHDIDVLLKFPNLYKYVRGAARILFKKKSFKGSLFTFTKHYLRSYLGKKDPYQTFSWLFNPNFFDKKMVFFMSGGTTKYDNLYDIEDASLKNVFQNALSNNYEIGLHPSYAAYNDENQFLKEKKKLEKVTQKEITSSRQHILHYDVIKTPNVLEISGIQNDYTIGYQDRIGFRSGTGFEYYLWNNLENKMFFIKETPLVIMDGCLLIEAEYSVKKAKEIHDLFFQDNNLNTQITYNFHNSIFDPVLLDSFALKQFYLEL